MNVGELRGAYFRGSAGMMPGGNGHDDIACPAPLPRGHPPD